MSCPAITHSSWLGNMLVGIQPMNVLRSSSPSLMSDPPPVDEGPGPDAGAPEVPEVIPAVWRIFVVISTSLTANPSPVFLGVYAHRQPEQMGTASPPSIFCPTRRTTSAKNPSHAAHGHRLGQPVGPLEIPRRRFDDGGGAPQRHFDGHFRDLGADVIYDQGPDVDGPGLEVGHGPRRKSRYRPVTIPRAGQLPKIARVHRRVEVGENAVRGPVRKNCLEEPISRAKCWHSANPLCASRGWVCGLLPSVVGGMSIEKRPSPPAVAVFYWTFSPFDLRYATTARCIGTP